MCVFFSRMLQHTGLSRKPSILEPLSLEELSVEFWFPIVLYQVGRTAPRNEMGIVNVAMHGPYVRINAIDSSYASH